MNIYVWSGLFSFFANLIVGLFVYARNPSNRNNRLFAVFSFCVGGWSVGSFLANIMPDTETSLTILRINYLFAVLLPAFYLHFIYSVTNSLTQRTRHLVKFSYLLSALFIPFIFMNAFIKSLKVIPGTNFYISDPGPVYFVFFTYFAVSMSVILIHLLMQIKEGKIKEEPQFKYLVIANGLAIFAGFEYFSRVFNLFHSPPFDDYVLVVYVFVLSFAMKRYRLFDVETIAQAFQREKLATIGLLAASVNHEIRNPLYAAKGLLETYVENEKAGLPRKTPLEISEKALSQLNRALDVINKLNRFSKPATEESNQIASVPEAIQAVLDLVAYEFELDKIHIKNEVNKNIPAIKADHRQLEEILFNLIVNACQAMPKGGTLTISSVQNDSKVIVEISDTGTGISPEQAKNLFEPFHTTKGEKGTGLGLYITKQLIERNGGKITVKSEAGEGTSFILEFKIS